MLAGATWPGGPNVAGVLSWGHNRASAHQQEALLHPSYHFFTRQTLKAALLLSRVRDSRPLEGWLVQRLPWRDGSPGRGSLWALIHTWLFNHENRRDLDIGDQ